MTGKYIVFEGINGSGKTTQAKLLLPYLRKITDKEVIYTREPGAQDENDIIQSHIAEDIRRIVQGKDYQGLHGENQTGVAELLGYSMSRAHTLPTIVKPVLEKGGIVIADRSYLSSAAFQGNARGLGIKNVLAVSKMAIQSIEPDLIIYIDLKPEIALTRTHDKEGDKHEKEGREYHQKTYEGYKILSEMPQFKDRWVNIDGSGTKEEVYQRVVKEVTNFLQSH